MERTLKSLEKGTIPNKRNARRGMSLLRGCKLMGTIQKWRRKKKILELQTKKN